MITPFTIGDGEAVALRSPGGTRSIVDGPKVVFAPFKKVELLQRVVARDGEYLEVLFRDGRTEHQAGPCELWLDPLLHSSVEVRPAIDLDAHQAVVVLESQSGADLTAVLVAQQRNPDKLIRLEQHPSQQGELHLHEAV